MGAGRHIDTLGSAPGMPVRQDRIRQYVTAYCGQCHREDPDAPLATVGRLPGYLSEADGRVWLVRGCPTHGRIVTLYDESPEILDWLERWTAPTKHHVPDQAGNFDPPPIAYDRGLGELQTQHTCILLTDIVEGCNLSCPTCFTDSPTKPDSVVPLDTVLANIDQRLARENGRLDVVMLSGGEPTLHPELPRLLDELCERDIHRILINTNGVTLSRDDGLLGAISRHDERVEVYLQFDGLRASTHRHHRAADLGAIKARTIARLSEAEIFTTLTMTATLGVNDDEIGDVIGVALANDFVGGVSIQPQFGSGRGDGIDPLDRLTHTGVLARLADQTGGVVTWRDLTALPCSHPHCASVGYLLKTDDDTWRSLIALIGEDELADHLDLVANKVTSPELARQTKTLVKQALLGLLSDQTSLSHPDIGRAFRTVCDSCDLGVGALAKLVADQARPGGGRGRRLRRLLAERVVRVTVKPFMDIDTMIEPRLLQCCVHVGTRSTDGADQCAPFCAVQAWGPLADQRLSSAAATAPVGQTGPVPVTLGRGR
ncbi:MAG: radical SAM protein [Actinomycetota bacterium]